MTPKARSRASVRGGAALLGWTLGGAMALADPAAAPATPPARPEILQVLQEEADRLESFVSSDLGRSFLMRVGALPIPSPRTILRVPGTRMYYSQEGAAALADAARAALEPVEVDARTYYTTKYGSPLAYVRALDLAGAHGLGTLAGRRVVDFGYGTAGHLRLMAATEVIGVDVDPYLAALYSLPEDQGTQRNPSGPDGAVRLLDGRWPGDADVRRAAGGGWQLFLSKNTLKRGYVHPERETDPERLLHLGVDEEAFVRAVFEGLSPGGLFLIYNLSPPQSPPDQPYLPWADGRCAFSLELLQAAGFEIVFFDRDDSAEARRMARLLRWDEQGMDPETGLFAHATLARRPTTPPLPAADPAGRVE